MHPYVRTALAAAAIVFVGLPPPAAAERVIAYNAAYLPELPQNHPRIEGPAVLVMSPADAALEEVRPEAGMPLTLARYRIRAPIGSIVSNVAAETFGEVFVGGANFGNPASGGGVVITLSELSFGYDYRQADERRPPGPGEFIVPSTPSAQISMRITFADADGALVYDTFNPPFRYDPPPCPRSLDCSQEPRRLRLTVRGEQQSGMGNSQEVINRALHRAVQLYLLIATCEYSADATARSEGRRITAEEATLCSYLARGYELVGEPLTRP